MYKRNIKKGTRDKTQGTGRELKTIYDLFLEPCTLFLDTIIFVSHADKMYTTGIGLIKKDR